MYVKYILTYFVDWNPSWFQTEANGPEEKQYFPNVEAHL